MKQVTLHSEQQISNGNELSGLKKFAIQIIYSDKHCTTWYAKILRNLMAKELKGSNGFEEFHIEDINSDSMNCAYYYELGTTFELDEIHEFLSELPSAHCSVIKLYAIGTPIEEISSKTGKSRSQVIKELGLYKGILN